MVRLRGWGLELGRRHQHIAALGLHDGSFMAPDARPVIRYDFKEDDCAVIRRLTLASIAIMGSTHPAARRSTALSPLGAATTASSVAIVAAARQMVLARGDPLDRSQEPGYDGGTSGSKGGKAGKSSGALARREFS